MALAIEPGKFSNPEAYSIASGADRVTLTGASEQALLYAVFDFLERQGAYFGIDGESYPLEPSGRLVLASRRPTLEPPRRASPSAGCCPGPISSTASPSTTKRTSAPISKPCCACASTPSACTSTPERLSGPSPTCRSSSPARATSRFSTTPPRTVGATCRSARRALPWAARSSTTPRCSAAIPHASRAIRGKWPSAPARSWGGLRPRGAPRHSHRHRLRTLPDSRRDPARAAARSKTQGRHAGRALRYRIGDRARPAGNPARPVARNISGSGPCVALGRRADELGEPQIGRSAFSDAVPAGARFPEAPRAEEAPGAVRLGRRGAPLRILPPEPAGRHHLLLPERLARAGTRCTRSSASSKAASAGPFRGSRTTRPCGCRSSTCTASSGTSTWPNSTAARECSGSTGATASWTRPRATRRASVGTSRSRRMSTIDATPDAGRPARAAKLASVLDRRATAIKNCSPPAPAR